MDRSAEDALKQPFKRTSRAEEREKARAKKRVRTCEAPGCNEEGQFPAPKSRRRVNERYHFCLELASSLVLQRTPSANTTADGKQSRLHEASDDFPCSPLRPHQPRRHAGFVR